MGGGQDLVARAPRIARIVTNAAPNPPHMMEWRGPAAPAAAGMTRSEVPSMTRLLARGHPIVLNWNGVRCQQAAAPRVPRGYPRGGALGLGNISAGKSGVPQWIGGSTNTDTSWHLRYSGRRWTPVPGVTTPGRDDNGMQVIAIPGANAAWAIGTWVDSTNASEPRIEYASPGS
jgi:hypothetical protein